MQIQKSIFIYSFKNIECAHKLQPIMFSFLPIMYIAFEHAVLKEAVHYAQYYACSNYSIVHLAIILH